jgi:ribonuclease BN (tRNA processing enzyme)
MLKIIILGSGTSIPYKRRGTPGIFVNSNNNLMLMDAGSGTISRLAKLGIDYKKIDFLLFSHFHPDHTLDLVSLLFALNHTPGHIRKKNLVIIGPIGLKIFIQKLQNIYPLIIPKSYSLIINEVTNSVTSFDGFKLQSRSVDHYIPTIAFRLSDDNSSAVISGDTSYCDGIIQISEHTDLLILEASFPLKKYSAKGHLTAKEAGKIARIANAKTLVLKHLYPICDNYDMKALSSGEFDGNIIISEDYTELVLDKGILKSRILE